MTLALFMRCLMLPVSAMFAYGAYCGAWVVWFDVKHRNMHRGVSRTNLVKSTVNNVAGTAIIVGMLLVSVRTLVIGAGLTPIARTHWHPVPHVEVECIR